MRVFGLVIKGIYSNNSVLDFILIKTNLSNSKRLIDTDSWDLLITRGARYSYSRLVIGVYSVCLLYYPINNIIENVNSYLFERLISRKEKAYNSRY